MELKRWPWFLAMTFMFSFRAFAFAQELNEKPDVPSLDAPKTSGAIVAEDVKDEDDKSVNDVQPPAIKLNDLLMQNAPANGIPTAELPKYMIGVALAEVPASLRAHIAIEDGQGIMIGFVRPDSPAAKAGLQQYDIILKSGEKALKHPKELQVLVDAGQEKPVSMTIFRRGELKTVEITPVKRESIKGANNPYSLQLLPGGYTIPDHGNMSIKLPDGRTVQLAYPEHADQGTPVAPPPVNQLDSLTQSIQSLTQQMERLQQAIDRLEKKSMEQEDLPQNPKF